MEKAKKTSALIMGILVLILSIYIKFSSSLTFYKLVTLQYEGSYITYDVANVREILWAYFKYLGGIYIKEYIFPSLLLLVSVILFSWGIYGKKIDTSSILRSHKVILALMVWVFLFTLWIHFFTFLGICRISDEFSYCFQADILSSGKLYAKSPPLPQFFISDNIISNGKWYSKYTIGWPLLLALPNILKIKFIVNPTCAALSVYLVYLILLYFYRRKEVALAGATLLSVSPFFTFMGASYLAHTSTGLFALLYIYSLIRITNNIKNNLNPTLKYSTLAGISMLWVMIIRPVDAFILFIGSAPFYFYTMHKGLKQKELKKALNIVGTVAIFIILGLSILMYTNQCQNGNPFVFSFSRFDPTDKWGFGIMGHTPLLGMWNLLFSIMRNSMWSMPFVGILSLISLKYQRKNWFLFLPILGFYAFYFCFFSLGVQNFGIRYYYIPFLLAYILASYSLFEIAKALFKTMKGFKHTFIQVFTIFCLIFTFLGVYPKLIPYTKKEYVKFSNILNSLKKFPPHAQKKLIFIKNEPQKATRTFTRNLWNYTKDKNLLALFLLPEENRKLINKFPNRKPYTATFNLKTGTYTILPYESNDKTPINYIFAGINYQKSLKDSVKSEYAFIKATETAHRDTITMYNLGYFYYSCQNYHKAINIFEKTIKKAPNFPPAYYYLGRSYGNIGNYPKACQILLTYIRRFPKSPNINRAKDWYQYYRNK